MNFCHDQGYVIESELDALRELIVRLGLMCVEDPLLHHLTYDLFYCNCELFGTILIALAIMKREMTSCLDSLNLSGTVSVMTKTIRPASKQDRRSLSIYNDLCLLFSKRYLN